MKESAVEKIRAKRKNRVRQNVKNKNKNKKSRIYFHVSNKNMYAQLIDDSTGKTIITVGTTGAAMAKEITQKKNKETAKKIAEIFAKKIQENKTAGKNGFVFDRGAKPFHGRVKEFAETLRESGVTI